MGSSHRHAQRKASSSSSSSFMSILSIFKSSSGSSNKQHHNNYYDYYDHHDEGSYKVWRSDEDIGQWGVADPNINSRASDFIAKYKKKVTESEIHWQAQQVEQNGTINY